MVLESLTLRNYGKAKLDMALENSGVYVGNQLVSNGAFVDRKNITFLFGSAVSEGFTIPAASSVIFSLQSMIAYARPGDDIELGLRYAEDFVIREMSSGFQTSITEKFRLENYPLHPGNLNVLRRWYRYRR
ncbi:hypothetical protein K9L63_01010 [Candidatus Gracilibacteria bacterium]|nr:hypothetical protein [Candidatus Gracilibacteria bacterium]